MGYCCCCSSVLKRDVVCDERCQEIDASHGAYAYYFLAYQGNDRRVFSRCSFWESSLNRPISVQVWARGGWGGGTFEPLAGRNVFVLFRNIFCRNR